jgi:phosphinothricin acetyltransferase
VEITLSVAPGHEGRGIGSRLYGELLPALRERGVHAVIGGIALPKFNRWIDVGYWHRTL